MTIAFFDASALVKLCTNEHGSRLAAELWNGADAVIISALSDLEVRSVFNLALHNDRISRDQYASMTTQWAAFAASARQVPLSPIIYQNANQLLDRYPLRATDAIQIASAQLLTNDNLSPTNLVLVTWDNSVATVAAEEGLMTLPELNQD
jgi:predicted nucleic acid-binding protein